MLLRDYQRGWLRPDLIAAFTLWAVIVPQAIAYAQIAGLPPQAGLFAAAAGLLCYALLGTCRQLVVSPTSSAAAVSAALVAPIAAGDPKRFIALSAALAILVGLALIALGLLRMGFVSRFISAAVQTGFMFGLGLTIIISQLPKLLGIQAGSGTFLQQTGALLSRLGSVHGATIAIGAAGLAALLVLQRFLPVVPAALVVVAGSTLAVALFGLADRGVAVLGAIDGAFPRPVLPAVSWHDLTALTMGAVAVAVIGFAESTTVAEAMSDKHHYDVNSNQELRAIGAANVLSGLFQGFVTGGGASQTAANDRAGARSQLSGLVVCGLTVVTAGWLLPLFRDLPQAALGAIVIAAVLGFINVPALRRIARLRTDSFVLALLALIGVLALGILPGLILAVLISVAILLGRVARPPLSTLGRLPDGEGWAAIDRRTQAQSPPAAVVLRLDAPLLFINAKRLRERAKAALTERPGTRIVVLDMSLSVELDVETLNVLTKLVEDCRERDAHLRLASVHAQAQTLLTKADIEAQVYPSIDAALLG